MKRICLLLTIIILSIHLAFADGKKDSFTKSTDTSVFPGKYELSQNYPNPFNPETTIKFQTAKEEYVTLKIYNLIGQEVKTVISEVLNSGDHEITINSDDLTSGVYFYTLTAGTFTQTKRMILLK